MNNTGFISIKTPCHESWSGMKTSETGKFCLSCQKDVHNFENASSSEIRRVYDDNGGKICGRIPASLLQEQFEEAQLRKFHGSTVKRFFFAALFCFGASLFTIDSAKASTVYKLKLSFLSVKASTDSTIIRGSVKGIDNKEMIAYARIAIYHGEQLIGQGVTDLNGRYSIKIPAEYKKVDVRFNHYGFEEVIKKNIAIVPGSQTTVNMKFEETEAILMGDVEYVPGE